MVASSWIDIEAGLSKKYIFRMPPGFCANAPCPHIAPPSNIPANVNARASKFISVPSLFCYSDFFTALATTSG